MFQVRSLFNKFYLNRPLTREDIQSLSDGVGQLLPAQLNCFPIEEGSYFERLNLNHIPRSTSRQVSHYYCGRSSGYQNYNALFSYFISLFKDFRTHSSRKLFKIKKFYLSCQQICTRIALGLISEVSSTTFEYDKHFQNPI